MEHLLYAFVFLGAFVLMLLLYATIFVVGAIWDFIDKLIFYTRQLIKRFCRYIS